MEALLGADFDAVQFAVRAGAEQGGAAGAAAAARRQREQVVAAIAAHVREHNAELVGGLAGGDALRAEVASTRQLTGALSASLGRLRAAPLRARGYTHREGPGPG